MNKTKLDPAALCHGLRRIKFRYLVSIKPICVKSLYLTQTAFGVALQEGLKFLKRNEMLTKNHSSHGFVKEHGIKVSTDLAPAKAAGQNLSLRGYQFLECPNIPFLVVKNFLLK